MEAERLNAAELRTAVTVVPAGIPVPVTVDPTETPRLGFSNTIAVDVLPAACTPVVVDASLQVPLNIKAPVVASFNCSTFTASVFAVPAVSPVILPLSDILPVTLTPTFVVSNLFALL